jgi:hypothetical protein
MVMVKVSMTEKEHTMRRSQRGVTFVCEDIEMDSLEPEVTVFVGGGKGLVPIKENDIEYLVASVDAFKEFDVSWKNFCVR